MKMIFTAIAALFMAGGAVAQTVTPAEPAAPMATEAMQPAAPAEPVAEPAPAATGLVEKDGKWWNGDKSATKAEISAHKKAMKAGTPG